MESESNVGSSKGKLPLVLSAISDVICTQQSRGNEHEPTSTEYFAAILATLKSSDDHRNELLQILEAVIPQTHVSVIRSQFILCSELMFHLLKEYPDDSKTTAHCLQVLSPLISMQESSDIFWRSIHALRVLNIFLKLLDDSRVRIRKIANNALTSVLQNHKRQNANYLRSYISEFCITVIKTCQRNNYKRSLCVILFLQNALCFLPDEHIVQIMQFTLALQECQQPILISAAFKMLDSYFQNYSNITLQSVQLVACINHLLTATPSSVDMESRTYYCTTLISAVIALYKVDKSKCNGVILTCLRYYMSSCEAEFVQIHVAVNNSIKRLISTCVDKDMILESIQERQHTNSHHYNTMLNQFLEVFVSILDLKYQPCWVFLLDSVRSLFSHVTGNEGAVLLRTYVEKLSDLYQAISAGFLQVHQSIELNIRETLSCALKYLGVDNFLTLVPLFLPFDSNHNNNNNNNNNNRKDLDNIATYLDSSRDWIINILHANLKYMTCTFQHYEMYILGGAIKFNSLVKRLQATNGEANQIHILRNKVVQLWSLFPSFCAGGISDIVAYFPKFSKILNAAMTDKSYPEILLHVTQGLILVVTNTKNKFNISKITDSTVSIPQDLAILRIHAQTFLPSVLSIVEHMGIGDHKFNTCIQFISAFASISPGQVVTNISKKLLTVLLMNSSNIGQDSSMSMDTDNEDTNNVNAVWMAVLLTLIPFQSNQIVELLYRTIKPLLSVYDSISTQKRAYNILDSLIVHHGNYLYEIESKLEMLTVITNTLLLCHVSSRYNRLKCVYNIIKDIHDQNELHAACNLLFGEIIICIKDSNKKSRDGVVLLLKHVCNYAAPEYLFPLICSGIIGETIAMRSASILTLCYLLHEQKSNQDLMAMCANLLSTIVMLFKEDSLEESRAILSLIRLLCNILPREVLGDHVNVIIGPILSDLGPHKARLSSRVRAILRKLCAKFDDSTIRSCIPPSDIPLLDYILKQKRKTDRKKSQHKESQLEQLIGSDSDNDSDDENDGNGEGKDGGGQNDEEDQMDVVEDITKRRKVKAIRVNQGLRNEFPTSLSELLEDQTPRSVFGRKDDVETNQSSSKKMSSNDNDDEKEQFQVQVTADGKVVISEIEDILDDTPKVVMPSKAVSDSNDAANSKPKVVKRQREPGEEYRSKKAGGDVWKKGMLEPHAYIPLDAKLLTKKNEKNALSHLSSVVKNGKRSNVARKGHTLNRKQKIAKSKHRN